MISLIIAAALGTPPASPKYAETIRYSYDARGRLVTVSRSGTVASRVTQYGHDRADNRTSKTTGAP